MAEFSVRGYVSTITTEKDRVKVIINEYKKGYSTKNEIVEDKNIKWSVYFPRYFTKYIPNNFHQGNLVEIKGEILLENRKVLIKGQTMNLYSIRDISTDLALKKLSKKNKNEVPDIDNNFQYDFNL